eukprot:g1543.t1
MSFCEFIENVVVPLYGGQLYLPVNPTKYPTWFQEIKTLPAEVWVAGRKRVVEFVEASSGWQIKGIERTSSNGQFIVTRPPLPKSMLDTLKRGFWDDSDDDDSTSNNNNLTSAPAPIADVEEASGPFFFSRRGEAMSIAASSGAASSVQSAGGTILHRGWDKAKRPRNQLREPSDVVDRVKRVHHAEDLSSAVAEVKKNMSLRQQRVRDGVYDHANARGLKPVDGDKQGMMHAVTGKDERRLQKKEQLSHAPSSDHRWSC